jgi:hypothetical protein
MHRSFDTRRFFGDFKPLNPGEIVPELREIAGTDGTHSSSIPASPPQTVSIPWRRVRKTSGETATADPGSSVAKNVPVLRPNHPTSQEKLPGVRQGSQSCLGSTQSKRLHLMFNHFPAICSQVTRQWSPENSRIQVIGSSSGGWGRS